MLICAVCALGVLFSACPTCSPDAARGLPSWLPHKQVALGLDLRGGSYLLLEVDVAAAERERLNSIDGQRAQRVARRQDRLYRAQVKATRSTFTIRDPDRDRRRAPGARARSTPTSPSRSPPDGAGTMRFSRPRPTRAAGRRSTQSIEIIRRRIDETGTKEPTIQREGAGPHPGAAARASTIRSTSRRCSGAPPS